MNVIKIMGRNGIDANMPGDRMTLPCAYWQGNQGITVLDFSRMHHFRRSTQTRSWRRNHKRKIPPASNIIYTVISVFVNVFSLLTRGGILFSVSRGFLPQAVPAGFDNGGRPRRHVGGQTVIDPFTLRRSMTSPDSRNNAIWRDIWGCDSSVAEQMSQTHSSPLREAA
jgi:hypothetical protein